MYPRSTSKPTSAESRGRLVVYHAGAVVDGHRACFAPGAIAFRDGVVQAVGEPADVRRTVGPGDESIDLPDRVLIPGLVNAHVHLELTAVGRRSYDGDFAGWLKTVRETSPDPADPMSEANRRYFAASATAGARRAIEAGTRAVGDITRFDEVYRAVADAGLAGVSYVELFGIGEPWSNAGIERISSVGRERVGSPLRRGLQPHAPYSAGPAVYRAAADSGLPLSTHLAESPDELRFVADGDGPFRDLLKKIGKWDDSFAQFYGRRETPVAWLDRVAKPSAALLAHCNDVSDDDIALIADRGWSVAYCPRASDYFRHRGHRYRDMLAAGVNVALGTDSIICHGSLSILDEMRCLYRRDGADPRTLLTMATIHGMRALQLDPLDASFAVGRSPGLLAIRYDASREGDPLAAALAGADDDPLWLEASR